MTFGHRVAGLVLVLVLALACGQPATHPKPRPSPSPSASPSPSPSPTPQAVTPLRLVIPAIGVNAPVDSVGRLPDGSMDVPRQADHVAWYQLGPAPGAQGDAVMDGHLDWTCLGCPAVFWNLHKLGLGDPIQVLGAGGATALFHVTGLESVPYTAHPAGVFATDGPPRLTLITCAGSWDQAGRVYQQRLIVNAA